MMKPISPLWWSLLTHPRADVADDLSYISPDNGQHQSVAFPLQRRPAQMALERLPRLGRASRLPIEVARHLWAGVIRIEVLEIRLNERPQV
jgi:hypothetical protein